MINNMDELPESVSTVFLDFLRPEDLLQVEQVSKSWHTRVWKDTERLPTWLLATLRENVRSSSGLEAKIAWGCRSAARRLARNVFHSPGHHASILTSIAVFSWPLSLSDNFYQAVIACFSAWDPANAILLPGLSLCRAYRNLASHVRLSFDGRAFPEAGLASIAEAFEPVESRGASEVVEDMLELWAKTVRRRLYADHGAATGTSATPCGGDPGIAWVASLASTESVPWRALLAPVRQVLFDPLPHGAGFATHEVDSVHTGSVSDCLITHALRLRKRGSPLMMSVIFVAVCRRAGLGDRVQASRGGVLR